MSASFTVRVVPTSADRRLAWALSVVFGLLTLAVIFYVVEPHRLFDISKYTGLGIVMTFWCLGTLLGMSPRRPALMRAHVDANGLRLGKGRVLPASKVRGVRAVRGRLGYSVAISGESDFFLEVEREEDARRLVTDLGGTWPHGPCSFRLPMRAGVTAQYVCGLVGLAGSLGYLLLVGIGGNEDAKALGLVAIPGGILSSIVFLLRPLLTRTFDLESQLVKGTGATSKHFELHRNPEVGTANITAPAALERGQESTQEWLARVDRLGERGGYREEAAPQLEDLMQLADDGHATPAVRLAAARLLARRHGGLPDQVRARVAGDLGQRVRIVTEREAEDAAAELEALGPAFDVTSGPTA